jgi:hypothetical protein
MNCKFEKIDNFWECLECSKRFKRKGKIESVPPISSCKKDRQVPIKRLKKILKHEKKEMETSEPTQFQRLKNFILAATKHAAQGFPMCSDEEVKKRYIICKTCPYLREKKGREYCRSLGCGCNISRSSDRYLNKLAWKTEKCPQGKWDSIE